MATKSVVYGDFGPVFRQVRQDDTSLSIPDLERQLMSPIAGSLPTVSIRDNHWLIN